MLQWKIASPSFYKLTIKKNINYRLNLIKNISKETKYSPWWCNKLQFFYGIFKRTFLWSLMTTWIEVCSVVHLLCQTYFIYDSSGLLAFYIVRFKFSDVSGVSVVHIITVCPHSLLTYRPKGVRILLWTSTYPPDYTPSHARRRLFSKTASKRLPV